MYTLQSNLHMVDRVVDSNWAEGLHFVRNEINRTNDDYREVQLMDRIQLIGLGGLAVSATRMMFRKKDLDRVSNIGDRIDLTLGQEPLQIVSHRSILEAANNSGHTVLFGQLEDTFQFSKGNDSWLFPANAFETL